MRLLCALSLLLVGFAHKPVSASAAPSAYAGVDIADYVLPDGTLPDLCLSGEEDGHHSGPDHCEACRIFGSADIPAPVGGYLVNSLSPAQHLTSRQDERPVRSILSPGASPRGPPLSHA
ncbi:hypothetical protein SAMN05877838_2531 [Hoeflea halophila]|uniref:DUF2946 family protein n=1 Tax=Hoeflea halophila TaxID=714899 RepID=A0A286IE76_9HYPH|nr:hypothetical protein SAMN05877838_2531 [Hoeflea halophila]